MAYKCLECGHIFEEGECASWYEHHPYGMGYAAEEFSGCPLCNGDFEEAERCEICGGEFLEDELFGGCVCEECIEEYKRDFETCYAVAKTASKEEIEINALLASLFSVDEIEAILYQQLESIKDNIDCSAFISEDKDWFAEKLVEEVTK